MGGNGPSPSELERQVGNRGGTTAPTSPYGLTPEDMFGSADSMEARTGAQVRQDRATGGSRLAKAWLDQLFGGAMSQTDEEGVSAASGMPMDGQGGVRSMQDLLNQIQTLNSAEKSYLQRRLYQGGFYASSAYTNSASITWGTFDPLTMQALTTAIEMAGANQVDNFDRFLEENRVRFGQTGLTADGRNIGAEMEAGDAAKTIDITLTDPDSIRLMAETTAIEVLGRKPTEKELAAITATIHQRQRDAQRAQGGNEDGPGGQSDRPGVAEVALLKGDRAFDLMPGDPTQAPTLDAEQRANVSVIFNVAKDMGLGDEYVYAAISAAIVESGLRNIGYGDRDSIGMYQQRDHYGTKAQRLDPYWATQKFFEEALRYNGSTIGEWVANTQRPAKQYRGRYDEVMGQAASIFALIKGAGATGQAAATGRYGAGAERAAEASSGAGKAIRLWDPVTRTYKTHVQPTPTKNAEGRVNPSLTFGGPIDRGDDPSVGATPFFDSLLGSSGGDPIYREGFTVDPNDIAEMELRRMDPKAYETRQAAMRALDFFSMLGSGSGAVSEQS